MPTFNHTREDSAATPCELCACQVKLEASERAAAAARAALQHCVDLGPPCPSCGAEDEESESAGLYPHHDGCLAWTALASDAGKDFVPRERIAQLEAENAALEEAPTVNYVRALVRP